ncbi:VanZ family protein [Streptomyces galbus]|uniref:VanZ family protein n=1 Tax=Streptomyces galbus TaxID=33898 RepID=UPI0037F4B6D0
MNIQFQVDASMVLGPLLALFACVAIIRMRRGVPGWSGRHTVLRAATALYGAAVLSLTVFPLYVTWGQYANQSPWYNQVNFIPLLTADVTAIPNIIMMIPLGFLLPLVSRRATSLWRAIGLSALASLCIEATQMLSYIVFNNGRSVDINDLLANTLGGLIGYALISLVLKSAGLRGPLLAAALPGSASRQRGEGHVRDDLTTVRR